MAAPTEFFVLMADDVAVQGNFTRAPLEEVARNWGKDGKKSDYHGKPPAYTIQRYVPDGPAEEVRPSDTPNPS